MNAPNHTILEKPLIDYYQRLSRERANDHSVLTKWRQTVEYLRFKSDSKVPWTAFLRKSDDKSIANAVTLQSLNDQKLLNLPRRKVFAIN